MATRWAEAGHGRRETSPSGPVAGAEAALWPPLKLISPFRDSPRQGWFVASSPITWQAFDKLRQNRPARPWV